ncbi:hypothetical protein LPJ78_004441 [Coemansia sp. RSA 989]|nr:hypothetical protein LPJ78_004441 [Coemansia sp. RSA 989]
MSMMAPFVPAGPYDRPMQTHAMALAGSTSSSSGVGSGGSLSASIRQQGQFLSQSLQQPPQSMYSLHGMPPPAQASQMRPPQPQINPLGSNFESGGPVSLHLKRDPGFGQNPLGEEGFDPAKQAAEMSSYFMLPVNSLQFPSYAAGGSTSLGSQPGPSNNRLGQNMSSGSSSNAAHAYRTPSLSSVGGQAARGDSMGGESVVGMAPGAGLPLGFDPMVLAQNLSSAYVSAIAGMPTTQQQPEIDRMQSKSTAARGKSASHSSIDDQSPGAPDSAKLRDLRQKIRSIISSVWANTECGRSAGMAGITMADDEEDRPAGMQSPTQLASGNMALISPSGDRSLDEHLLQMFFECVHPQLPIISPQVFYEAYSRSRVSSLLVSAMCAAASVFMNRIESERKAVYEKCSLKVREQFHDACFEPNLEVVQTALIMTLCEYRNGSLHRAWVYLSMGFRLAIGMGYHHIDAKLRAGPVQSSADIAHRETCRRAFWGAFLLDRYTAIGGGKALGINDSDISVLLPLSNDSWQSRDVAPPLSSLEFFKPFNAAESGSARSVSLSSAGAAAQATQALVSEPAESEARNDTNQWSFDSSPLTGNSIASRNSTPGSTSGWDGPGADISVLGHFIKLMTVVGQVAQYINSNKGAAKASYNKPSKGHALLDKALLRWKEELPPSLAYSKVKAGEAEPDSAVFVSCMHAVYHGAIIMLNRENMELLRDLPGQLDVSSNLAIRSLERCRAAAMQIVEIAHHICSLPASKTNALLPWALFQAGTLLIHFMIAGSTHQAQEEARAAILSLDCALRDELSRYWNVSLKYHMVLSNMVKAWERTRQATPSSTPLQQSANAASRQQSMQMQGQAGSAFGDSRADASQALYQHMQVPMQMHMHMQLPTQLVANSQHQQQQQQQQRRHGQSENNSFTLLKPYNGSSGSQQQPAASADTAAENANLMPNFMFTPNTAQDSLNTLNEFFSQLTQEQARQFSEGMQTYALQGGRTNNSAVDSQPGVSRSRTVGHNAFGNDPMLAQQQQHPVTLTNAALQHIQSAAAMNLVGQGSRVQDRRGSLPISSNSELFTAPNGPMFSSSTAAAPSTSLGQMDIMNSELDPFLFNPMTPFLQELQLFNGTSMPLSAVSGSSSTNAANGSISQTNARSHS